ncbi:MAG: XRE family transcriptional regulator [Deltaproteobacteria bacterium]|nr:MAG: XRE family transcriptional regulator [Deltaproteobacteria bacterium]TNF29926.1 MAG: XRE family transcriptional regulator [Deltaproteobacteria bacterium]
MDYKIVVSQIVRELRGDLSQEQLNRKLGFKSNQVYRWEKGHAKVDWDDFILLSKKLKLDLNLLLRSYFRFNGSAEDIPSLFDHLFAGQSLSRISKRVGISEGKLRRLSNGQTSITLDDFLKVIFGLDRMESLAFVHELAGNKTLASLKEEKKLMDNIVKSYFKHPELGLLLVCLNLPGYKKLSFHQDSWLAEVSGIELKKVNTLLKLCLELKLVEKLEGKYILTPFKLSDRGDRASMMKVRSFWTKKALDKQKILAPQDAYGSIVFTTSKSARDKIIGSYLRFFEEFKQIVEEDKSPHQIPLVMNFHLFNPGQED